MLDEQVQFAVCSTKQQMDGKHAKELAERMRRKGKRVMDYRCPIAASGTSEASGDLGILSCLAI